jgi:hypothetical protein
MITGGGCMILRVDGEDGIAMQPDGALARPLSFD